MNINLIKTAVEKYLLTTEDVNEKQLCVNTLDEIACVMERYDYADSWNNETVLLPADSWVELLDELTYDILGKLMKVHGSDMRPEYYCHDVRKECFGLENVAAVYLEDGYDILYDRWTDNEVRELHDTEGCWKLSK